MFFYRRTSCKCEVTIICLLGITPLEMYVGINSNLEWGAALCHIQRLARGIAAEGERVVSGVSDVAPP